MDHSHFNLYIQVPVGMIHPRSGPHIEEFNNCI